MTFAAVPAPILLSIIPRCAGKAQRGGWVGRAGDLVPLCRAARLPITSPLRFRLFRRGALDIIWRGSSALLAGFSGPRPLLTSGTVARTSFVITGSVADPPLRGGRILSGVQERCMHASAEFSATFPSSANFPPSGSRSTVAVSPSAKSPRAPPQRSPSNRPHVGKYVIITL